MGTKPRVVYWFRTDLRLHDSPALQAALDLEPDVLWPIFTWDPYYVHRARGGTNRWQFLLDCQNDLSESITRLNPKSRLFVLREAPQTLFPKLLRAWKATHLVFEKDTDAYARRRDEAVAKAAQAAGVEVITRAGRTLWDSDEVVAQHGGKPTMSMTQLLSAAKKLGRVPRPIAAPKTLPGPGDMPLDFEQEVPGAAPDVNAETRTRTRTRTSKDTAYKGIAGPKGDFAIETLDELGFPAATTPYKGGESIALKNLAAIVGDHEYTATFEKPKTSPAQFDPPSTTLLSPFLHFGALSVREFYWRVQDVVDAYGKGASAPPTSLTGQLIFRDMYFAAQAAVGAEFTQTLGNPHCRFIPWHLPSEIAPDTGLATDKYKVDSEDAEQWFLRWRQGVTGFPWIDALMRQLTQTGWMHHLGRHSVACFLTRGGCYVHWERGAQVFEVHLLDHEPACNAGNWQWLSCTAFFSQYFRCYSPVTFGQKWDTNGDLIRKWVPELKHLDSKYIYEPWKAPIQDQKKARVRVTGDGLGDRTEGTYPKPMFDFGKRREVCMNAMKTAYGIGLYGDDEKVVNGSWRELFEGQGEETAEMVGSDDGENADEGDEDMGEKRERKGNHGGRAKKQKT